MEQDIRRLLADAEDRLGGADYAGARMLLERVVDRLEQEHGPDSAELVAPLMMMAKACGENRATPSDQLRSQLDLQRRAVQIARRTLSDQEPLLALCHYRYGISLAANGAYEEALSALTL